MATDDAEREYGPTPEHATYEHTDIEPAMATQFAVWLTVALMLSAAVVYGTFWLFEGREQTRNQQAQTFPLAAGRVREPQGTRLQTQPFKDIYTLRQGEADKLTTYGWVDRGAGVVRIPVDEALRIVSERSAVPSRPQTPQDLDQVVQDSSSGRTAAQRY